MLVGSLRLEAKVLSGVPDVVKLPEITCSQPENLPARRPIQQRRGKRNRNAVLHSKMRLKS